LPLLKIDRVCSEEEVETVAKVSEEDLKREAKKDVRRKAKKA